MAIQPYPLYVRSILRTGKSRTQPAAFSMSDPRRGAGFAQATGTDVPVFWDVSFRFTQEEAQAFWAWFRFIIRNGVDEFTMPIRTEFGVIEHVCRFLPDSLLPAKEDGPLFNYTATVMARKLLVPAGVEEAAGLIVALPNWFNWSGLLDQTVNEAMPDA